jgi:nucleoside-diphosphate-sugar epimerase
MNKTTVFGGTGFIGSRFCQLNPSDTIIQPRNNSYPLSNDILYLISTTDNYNVLTNLHIDIDTNLTKLMDTLMYLKNSNNNYTFNFVSSWFVYGECQLPAREDFSAHPKGFYSITKKAAEDLLISFCKTFNINYRIFRLCNVYGPTDIGRSKKKNALQYLIDEIKGGRNINLYNEGKFIRDYMHVDDVCDAIKFCLEKDTCNEIINVGSGVPYEFRELIDFVVKETSYKGIIGAMEPTEFHKIVQVKDFYLDTTKLRNLGFKPKISIEEGLKQLL